MIKVTRRDIILSSAAAFAIFGLDKRVVLIGAAEAQQKAPTAAGVKPYARFSVGKLQVTNIYDGVWEKPHDSAFIKNASIDDVKKALKAAKLTDAHVPIPFTVTVVNTGKNLVMFDAGTGAQLAPTAGKMTDNMKAAKIDAAKIDTIIITHFHPDHIFGLMAKDTNAPVFPNAKIIVPENEYKFWTDPGLLAKTPEARQGLIKRIQAVFPGWKEKGVITFTQAGKDVLPGIKTVDTSGHTPGHVSYHISSGKAQFMVLGDVTNMAVLFAKNPGWHAAFDVDPVLAEKNRRATFDRAIADKILLAGYHWGMPGAGTLKKDGQGYALVPVKA
ncbi:MAG: MBL fold metallo-hydrolase [Hyphomicrobiaceae bacterium]|nr:MAG: MBL fold metallo-hydrolase [Hyphomicrobiaceae bacterium]